MTIHIKAYHYRISGQVQGVGFRPYIYRLAVQHSLVGWVKNLAGIVEIQVQGQAAALDAFADQLITQAPPLAYPHIETCVETPIQSFVTFTILASEATEPAVIHVPPDYFTCEACLAELHDPTDRRYRYPFINCTQCGPRYTLIKQLPYDRPHTSMADFPLCPTCLAEYRNPLDRRFHAQPLACPRCGPQLTFQTQTQLIQDTQAALTACITALRQKQIIAVKGIGGYHLLCAASSDTAILRLRANKPRPAKPLAVLLSPRWPGLKLTEVEADLLQQPTRPIVLVAKPEDSLLSDQLAPGLTEIGVMYPYSPLHHLLLDLFGAPVVATSANISGEPVLTESNEVIQRLGQVADAFLHHNRPIVRPADDAVYKVIADQPRPIRLGRGNTPLELRLPHPVPYPCLAVGGHLKNTIALANADRVIISPHIGDLSSPRSLEVFTQVIADLQRLYAIQAQKILCDAHPQYASSRWARQNGLPIHTVFHHHAHASALAGEYADCQGPWLIFTWDGVGFGADGTLWGGEALYGQPGYWRRLAHIRPFYLPGGEKASRELWRSALALVWETNETWPASPVETALLQHAWQKRLNCPQTTAVGRLFDAAAALTGLLQTASFEGQGPMLLEAACVPSITTHISLPLQKNATGLWQTDWQPLLIFLMDQSLPISQRATIFHNSLAQALLAQVEQIGADYPVEQIGLCGGVFQNRFLTEQVIHLLSQQGLKAYFPRLLPVNDAGISFGQIVDYNGGNGRSEACIR